MGSIEHEYPGLYYQEVSGEYDDIPKKTPKPMVLGDGPTEQAVEEEIEDSVTIDVNEIKFSTDKAWLLDTEVGEAWFPKSKCSLDEKYMAVTLPQWLFDRKF